MAENSEFFDLPEQQQKERLAEIAEKTLDFLRASDFHMLESVLAMKVLIASAVESLKARGINVSTSEVPQLKVSDHTIN